MENYDLISENPQSTVVARYDKSSIVAEGYQTESDLEREFIAQLGRQGYEYLSIHNAAELEDNLRRQIERLIISNLQTLSGNASSNKKL